MFSPARTTCGRKSIISAISLRSGSMPKRIFCEVGGLRYKDAAVAMFLKLLVHRLHDSCVKSVAEKETYSHSVVFQWMVMELVILDKINRRCIHAVL